MLNYTTGICFWKTRHTASDIVCGLMVGRSHPGILMKIIKCSIKQKHGFYKTAHIQTPLASSFPSKKIVRLKHLHSCKDFHDDQEHATCLMVNWIMVNMGTKFFKVTIDFVIDMPR